LDDKLSIEKKNIELSHYDDYDQFYSLCRLFCFPIIQGQLPYYYEKFKIETAIFFENQGELRIVGAQWELVTYILCSRFAYVLKTMFMEIVSQREQMYVSIGRYVSTNDKITNGEAVIRNKSGLINIIGTAMKTLFGVCDDDCTKETNINIEKIETSNVNMLHILKSQTTVVKSVVQRIGNTSTEMNKLYVELGQKQGEIYKKLNEAANHTHTLETLILSNRIHNIFTALVTQFSYETTTISAIISATRTGILHPSLVTPRELAKQLIQIKLNLPVNLNVPMGTKANEIYELSKITKMAVYYSGTQIVFLIKIPLITELELTLFKIIPIPHRFGYKHSIILKLEF